jgi:DNA topoisomerase-1
MRSLRLPWLLLFVTASLASFQVQIAYGLEDGCIVNLQSDLKRQDLAEAIGLHYYKERPAGIRRTVTERKSIERAVDKKGVATDKEKITYEMEYFDPSGRPVKDVATLERIKTLGIPPAYVDVWISPDAESHILAIGHDARGRPQYAYHPKWIEATSTTKFIRMRNFGKNIANVRRTTLADLRSPGITKSKLLAAASMILETGSIRVGSEEYVRENGTYGLTTLLHDHVSVSGDVISFDFIGKEKILHRFSIENPEVAPVVAELLRQPGPRLFAYRDEAGLLRTIDADDLKRYLQGMSGGENFTAKDFRTWQGTSAAARKLIELGAPIDAKDAEEKINVAVVYASSILRNKPGTARENYIHPLVLETYGSGTKFQDLLKKVKAKRDNPGLPLEERFVLELVKQTEF